MKKFVFQMQLLLLALLFSFAAKSNPNSGPLSNEFDSLPFSDDTCIANFFYNTLGNGQYIFYDSLSFYGDDATVIWTIEDSIYSNVHYVSHTFPEGITSATVCLTITTADSNTCINCQSFAIRQDTVQYCHADFNYAISDTVFDGFTRVYFTNASTTSDPLISSKWYFGDGGRSDEPYPYHDYNNSNDSLRLVGLFINTSSGCMDSVFRYIFIPPTADTTVHPCQADFTYEIFSSDSAAEGFTRIKFTNTSVSSDPITLSEWQFADGGFSNDMHPIHDYYINHDTILAVYLTIATSSGCMDTVVHNIFIPSTSDTIAPPCRADFYTAIVSTDSTFDGFSRIQFTNSSVSSDPITSSQWYFGDGEYSFDMNPVHDYYASLDTILIVGLSIATSSGCRDTVYQDVFIPASSDTSVYTCNADFTYEMITADSSGAVFPVVYFYNASSGVFLDYLWSFGDNTYSTEFNPSHTYYYTTETTVIVKLAVNSPMGCTDTITREITLTAGPKLFSLSGEVNGKNELLPQGTLVLYKKSDKGYFNIEDATVINNGVFTFNGLSEGKYLLYAMPHMYYSGQYLPTYYVNKLQWYRADVIDLNSNIGDITLELITTRHLGFGPGRISGTINWNSDNLKSTNNMKSMELETGVLVYLCTESGEVVDVCAPDEYNNYAFNDLLYGTYSLMIESVNLPENKTNITLSSEMPSVGHVDFNIDGYLVGISNTTSESNFKVYSVSDEEIGIQINQGGAYKVTVIDMSGTSIFETTETFNASAEKIISIGDIPDGIYLIRLQNNTSVLTQKIRK